LFEQAPPGIKKTGKSMSYICGIGNNKMLNLLYLTKNTPVVKKYF